MYLFKGIFKLKISIRSVSLNDINFSQMVEISLGGKLSSSNFQNTFKTLRELLKKHEKKLRVQVDKEDTYYLNAVTMKRKKQISFLVPYK